MSLPSIARLALLFSLVVGLVATTDADAQTRRRTYLPFVPQAQPTPTPTATPSPTPSPTPEPSCPTTGERFDTVPTTSGPPSPPAEVNPDLNLTIRGWVTVNEHRGLVDYGGGTDPAAPQLYSFFTDDRLPTFTSTHRVYDWDWTNNRRGQLIAAWPVTLLGLGTRPGEMIRLPRRSGSDIYQGVYYALVVYAEKTRISLHYARNDYIAPGYGMHVENVCVDPNLLSLYQLANASGRGQLPALRNNQTFGTARGDEMLAAIRDTGSFMDPRARKDWWAGRAAAADGAGGTTGSPRPTATAMPTPQR